MPNKCQSSLFEKRQQTWAGCPGPVCSGKRSKICHRLSRRRQRWFTNRVQSGSEAPGLQSAVVGAHTRRVCWRCCLPGATGTKTRVTTRNHSGLPADACMSEGRSAAQWNSYHEREEALTHAITRMNFENIMLSGSSKKRRKNTCNLSRTANTHTGSSLAVAQAGGGGAVRGES